MRRQAAVTLGEAGAKARQAVPELAAALEDPDDAVRIQAANALWSIGAEARGAVPALTAALFPMHVLVRVDVRRIAAHQPAKGLELAMKLRADGRHVVLLDDLVDARPVVVAPGPFAQVEMQADAEHRMGTRISGSLGGGGPAHHQARAGYDAALVRFDDAAIHALALTEIVGVDDDEPARRYRHGRTALVHQTELFRQCQRLVQPILGMFDWRRLTMIVKFVAKCHLLC